MEALDLAFALAGGAAVCAAVLPGTVRRWPVSLPMLFLGGGVLLFLLPLGLPDPDPVAHRSALLHLTELCLIVSLMGAGLALNRPFGRRAWSTTGRLLIIVLPLTTLAVAAVAGGLLGWPPAAALLLGAVLSPTDPVLASDVQVGEPADDEEHDDDEVRFGLTSEAGLNDGLAFPFVYAAVALGLGGAGWSGGWLGEWLLKDVLYACAVGVLVGVVVGRLLGRMFFRSERPSARRLAERSEGFVALAATLLAYGVAEVAHGYGFIAVFTAGCAIRSVERSHGYHGVLHGFIEQTERLLTVWLLLLVGGFAAVGGLAALSWRGALVGVLLVLVFRPVIGWLALRGGSVEPRERRAVAFFGIRGIGSLFYLAYALGETGFGVPAEELWAIVTFTVMLSVCVHGVTSTPALAYLDRLRHRRRRRTVPEPRPASP
ncbi:cation:proton antiporter [Actinomadura flavalba]|uniref:cation:proton antiporter n=1 Tax=Actinomadura flavalba TaxID=1120938 RepID=UPI00035CE5F6|nr:cation:proton antiporter [Actinomadura flavalba]